MNSNVNYTGVVTLKLKYKDRVIHAKHFNSGTDTLLKTYAKALAGYSIESFLPTYFNVGYMNGTEFHSVLTPTIGASVVRSYVDDESKPKDAEGCTRITVTLSRNMINVNALGDSQNIRCTLNSSPHEYSPMGTMLAYVDFEDDEASDFLNMLQTTTAGTQLIIVWDLFVVNSKEGK